MVFDKGKDTHEINAHEDFTSVYCRRYYAKDCLKESEITANVIPI